MSFRRLLISTAFFSALLVPKLATSAYVDTDTNCFATTCPTIDKSLVTVDGVPKRLGDALAAPTGNVSGASVTATGSTIARTQADRAADLVNVKDKGAKGDGRITSPIVTLSGTSLVTGVATFSAADVGKIIVVAGAGVSPVTGPVQAVPLTSAGAGYASVPTCAITDGAGSGANATCVALMKIQSATLTTGGSGCVNNGVQTFLVAIDATGTSAQITGTVTGGVLQAGLTVSVPGVMTAMGATTSVTAYGDNCTSAPTVSLSYGVAGVQVTALGTGYSTGQTTAALSGGSPSAAATLGTPSIGAPVAPLVTTIASYTSPTQVTLSASASTAIAATATKLLWASDDRAAFQSALSGATGIWVPAGTYWIGGILDPGNNMSIRGEGMQNTILAFDGGTSVAVDSGNWIPLFRNNSGTPASQQTKGGLEFVDLQLRGILDFGRTNVGAPAMEFSNYTELTIDRVKFTQMPNMAQQNESVYKYIVQNSIFDTVMRDQARCRSCFSARIIGNTFLHSDDDSVALHQAYYLNSPGIVREGIVVEGNTFEDTTCIQILGARQVVIRGNILRRCKSQAIRVSYNGAEGINQIRGVTISDNIITDPLNRLPISPNGQVIDVEIKGASAPTNETDFIPGAMIKGTSYFGKPWDFDLNNVTSGTQFAPPARGVNIHDNKIMRTLPATPLYSAWGYGKMLTNAGFYDTPVPDSAMRPTNGLLASVNVSNLNIHNNDIQDVGYGIILTDAVTIPEMVSVFVNFNHIANAISGGVISTATGNFRTFDLIGNDINVDPYGMSPGRGPSGSWTVSYAGSQCFLGGAISAVVKMAFNTFSNCYSISAGTGWQISHNVIRGNPWTGSTGQLTGWTASNFGIGVYPNFSGNQFFLSNVIASPNQGNTPSQWGTIALSHITSAAAAPTTGYHVINDMIWSTAPGTCTCTGWLALTTGSAWVSGTDYKVVPIQ